MNTLLVYAPAMGHTLPNHPESHGRMLQLLHILERHGVRGELRDVEPELATQEQLERVHTADLIEQIRQVSRRGGGLLDHGDTYATEKSFELASLAVGGCCRGVDHILTGKARNGIALVRPPGHHAERDRVSGFCLFNNVAAAARQAQAVHGVHKVLILDFDVHHGNGTQDIFYDDDTVLFVSMHLYAPFFYPGVGSLNETGVGKGSGYTINVPLPPFVGDMGYLRVLEEVIRPRVTAFNPDLILVSAGFDAHWQDPLAVGGLSLTGYARIAQQLVEMADELCNGRVLFVLEGGYLEEALNYGVLNAVYALIGRDEIYDGLGMLPRAENSISELLDQLKQRHLLI